MLSPDIGGLELLIVAAVALIVVGPKDLPVMLRKLGQFIARLRGMAAEFRASFDDMARQSELEDLRKEVEAMRSGQYAAPLQDPSIDQVFSDIDAGLKSGEVTFAPHQASMGLPDEPAPEPPVQPAPARKSRARAAATAKAKAPAKSGSARTKAAVSKAKSAPEAKAKAASAKAPAAKGRTVKGQTAKSQAAKAGAPARTRKGTA